MATIDDLTPDPRNARKHSPRNVGMIEESIQRDGFGRSILTAKDGTIIAGNATVEAAVSAGLVKVRTVETTGDEVIEVRRTDVEPGSTQFHNLAVADNRSAELAAWDADMLRDLAADVDLAAFWQDDELATLFDELAAQDVTPPADFDTYDETIETEHRCPSCGYEWSGKSS